MYELLVLIWPETLLVVVGCVLLLLGITHKPSVRRLAPVFAVGTLVVTFAILLGSGTSDTALWDRWNTVYIFKLQEYIKLIAAGASILLALLAWPTNPDATGNPSIEYGHECGEFYGLMLLSIAGIFVVASANDIILLFLGIELASFPTYIMVSISRPLPVAQEAGVKYFFLGAMAAALMLFGFSYLYGTTGQTNLERIAGAMDLASPGHAWQLLAVVMVIVGIAFKLAAVPLHAYAADVYQGAATPVTAFLAFVPKTSGFVALIKVLYYVSQHSVGSETVHWFLPDTISKLLWVLAVLTMFVGNVLGLLQYNVKRVLAYSSIAHTGYMLVGVTVLVSTDRPEVQAAALGGVLFYLAAYGIMNTGAFGVLMMLPSRDRELGGFLEPADRTPEAPAATGTSAETFDDIAGQGRNHPALGVAMFVCCWSLTGLPLTIGFFGKAFLIVPAWQAATGAISTRMTWLVVLTVINAAISAAYYLRIIATMYLRPEPSPIILGPSTAPPAPEPAAASGRPWPIMTGIGLSVLGTIAFGVYLPATDALSARTQSAQIDSHAPQNLPPQELANAK